MSPNITVIIPLFNEEVMISKLYDRVLKSLSSLDENFEVLCINDGSSDSTEEKLLEIHQKDKRFKILSFSRNFGHQASIWAGLEHAKGKYIGIMDGDLQDPPELFASFHEKLASGYDVVYAVRKKRKENFLKRFAYFLFYRILSKSSHVKIPLDSGDFSMFTSQVRDQMVSLKERNPFIRGIRTWVGFRQLPFIYERDERDAGEVKYTFKKLVKLAFDGFFGFSNAPIRLMGNLGLFIMFGCIAYTIYILIMLFAFDAVPQGFTTMILAIMFFGGVQLFSIRVIGEYVYRIFDESRQRPIYIVKKFYQ